MPACQLIFLPVFREYKYKFAVDSDVLNPRSAELERAFNLETYDRAVANPTADQEKVFVDLLMASNPKTSRNPKDYVMKQQPMQPQQMGPDGQPLQPGAGQQANGGSLPKPPPPIFSKSMAAK